MSLHNTFHDELLRQTDLSVDLACNDELGIVKPSGSVCYSTVTAQETWTQAAVN